MTRGRKPIPVELHRDRGTFRADRHGDPSLHLPNKLPSCPSHLDKLAKKEYRRAGKSLNQVITEADRCALAGYAQWWSRWVQAELNVAKTGMVIKVNGQFQDNPYLRISLKASQQWLKFAVELGLTPSARCRLKVPAELAPSAVPSRNRGTGPRLVG